MRYGASIAHVLLCGSLAAALSGCSSEKAQPVSAADFYAPSNSRAQAPLWPYDRPGILTLPDSPTSSPPLGAEPLNNGGPSVLTQGDLSPIPPLPTTRQSHMTKPATRPSTGPSPQGDQYLTLGGVVMVVNGRPIFANEVLRRDVNILREYARRDSYEDFQIDARDQIDRTIEELKNDQMEIAAAERSLDPKDVQLARILTADWAKHQIGEVSGSEEVARIRAEASGETFEDQEQDKYQFYLLQLYYYKKVRPQIDISPDEERQYYRAHIDEFSTVTQAHVILIEADPANLDSNRQEAIEKLKDIRKRSLAGEDFAEYARNQNDLPGAMGDGGNGGQLIIKPNTFVYPNVEAQVWKLAPGQISNVIEDHDLYFLVKVMTRDTGGTKAFADQAVQSEIYKRLSDAEFERRREAEIRRLVMEEIVYQDPHMIDAAVDMAEQNYPRWSKEKSEIPSPNGESNLKSE